MSKTKPIQVGVFVPGDSQMLDLACVDVLHMMSKEYLSLLPLPAHMLDIAPSMAIHYITSSANEGLMIPMTANATIRATHDMSHPDVQPGKLDIVLVPGPNPSSTWEKPVLEFLAGHARHEGTDVLSVCTGIILCGAAGILDGKTVSGPRGLVDELRKRFPAATFVGDQYRWVQDGNFWSSGGITNGNDLVSAYARSSRHFPPATVELACKMADVGDRGQFYAEGQTAFTLSMVWTILRGWFTKPKRA